MENELINALDNDTIYDFISNNAWKMDKDYLASFINEFIYATYKEDEKSYKRILQAVKTEMEESL